MFAQLVSGEIDFKKAKNWEIEACLKTLRITSALSKLLTSFYSTYCENDASNVNSTGCIFANRHKNDEDEEDNKKDKQDDNRLKKRDTSIIPAFNEVVYLNFYNLFETHPSLKFLKCIDPTFTLNEIYHTSISYKKMEFYYGFGGLQIRPDSKTVFGRNREQIPMDKKQCSVNYFVELMKAIARLGDYTAENYNLFENNCNSFTGKVIEVLKFNVPRHKFAQDTVLQASKTTFGQLLKGALLISPI